jgi:hypothetical protein
MKLNLRLIKVLIYLVDEERLLFSIFIHSILQAPLFWGFIVLVGVLPDVFGEKVVHRIIVL